MQAERGPIVDIASLGDPMALQAEAKKRKLDSAERDDRGKVKKVKKEKKVRRDKNEKVRSTLSGIDCCHSV